MIIYYFGLPQTVTDYNGLAFNWTRVQTFTQEREITTIISIPYYVFLSQWSGGSTNKIIKFSKKRIKQNYK